MERVLIQFDRYSMPYGPGEIAGFAAERAGLYVKNNIAHYCDPQGARAKAPVAVKVVPPSVRVHEAAAAAAAPAAPPQPPAHLVALQALAGLRDRKAVTAEEFEAEKARILAAVNPPKEAPHDPGEGKGA